MTLASALVQPMQRPLGNVSRATLYHGFAHGVSSQAFTFTRSTKAWGWVSDGSGGTVLKEFASGAPRFVVDPATGESLGYLAEGQATNELLDNRDLSTGNWNKVNVTVSQDETGLDGVANTAWTVTDSDGSSLGNVQQGRTVSDNTDTHASLRFLKKSSGASTFPLITYDVTGGTTAARSQWFIDTDNGAANARSGLAGDGTATVRDAGDYWEVEVTVTNNNNGNTDLEWRIYPAATSDLSNTDDSLTGSIVYDFGGIRLNATEFGYPIETGASAVTRNADDASEPLPSALADGFVWVVHARTASAFPGTQNLASVDDGTSDNRIVIQQVFDGDLRIFVVSGGAAFSLSATLTPDTDIKVAARCQAGNWSLVLDGVVEETSTGSFPSGLTTKNIGTRRDGADPWNSTIALDYLDPDPSAWTDADLQNASAL